MLVKCNHCQAKDTDKNDMECEEKIYESGSIIRKYYHKGKCWDEYSKLKEFTNKENEELNHLNEVIKKLHNIEIVPSAFFSGYLQGLRNGNFKMGKKTKKFKEGFSYKLIADTYEFCSDSIKWAKTNRKFDGTTSELKYCLAIVVDKIAVVKKKQDRIATKKQLEEVKSSTHSFEVHEFEHDKIEFKKKKVDNDISAFLD